jgi:hypothetical protein
MRSKQAQAVEDYHDCAALRGRSRRLRLGGYAFRRQRLMIQTKLIIIIAAMVKCDQIFHLSASLFDW